MIFFIQTAPGQGGYILFIFIAISLANCGQIYNTRAIARLPRSAATPAKRQTVIISRWGRGDERDVGFHLAKSHKPRPFASCGYKKQYRVQASLPQSASDPSEAANCVFMCDPSEAANDNTCSQGMGDERGKLDSIQLKPQTNAVRDSRLYK